MSQWTPLDESECDPSPFVQFGKWFEEAKSVMAEREAVALVTSTLNGEPSARMVLLRHVDDHSFGWYTNYESRKGRELDVNPHGALLWYNEGQGRQIRIEGTVAQMSAEESDAYFATRARGHQISAHASSQSETLDSRKELEERGRELEVEFSGRDVPRPEHWGGFRLTPTYFEFWQHREDRLHDRVCYLPDGEEWHRHRLAP